MEAEVGQLGKRIDCIRAGLDELEWQVGRMDIEGIAAIEQELGICKVEVDVVQDVTKGMAKGLEDAWGKLDHLQDELEVQREDGGQDERMRAVEFMVGKMAVAFDGVNFQDGIKGLLMRMMDRVENVEVMMRDF